MDGVGDACDDDIDDDGIPNSPVSIFIFSSLESQIYLNLSHKATHHEK